MPRHGHRSYVLVNSFIDAFDGVQRSLMRDVKIQDLVPRVILHQCGFQGCRVGEASNPGPVVTRQGRRSQRSRTPMSTFRRTKSHCFEKKYGEECHRKS